MSGRRSRVLIHSLEAHRLGDGLGDEMGDGLGNDVLRRLSHRAVLLSRPGDVVIVDSMPDARWVEWVSGLLGARGDGIGDGLGEIVVAGGEGETLVDRALSDRGLLKELGRRIDGDEWDVEPYMGGEGVRAFCTEIGGRFRSPEVRLLDRLNLKSNLGPVLHEIGLPSVTTTVACRDAVVEVARSMLGKYGALIVRSDLSIGGHGVWMVNGETDLGGDDLHGLALGIKRSSAERLFVISPMLEVTSSPNVQYDIGDDGAGLLGVSDQQMTVSFAFGGNAHPSSMGRDPGLLEQGARLGAWLHGRGYRGMVGIDFIVTVDGEVYVVEINPRVNTSSFPLLLSGRLGCGAFRLLTGIEPGVVMGFAGVAELLGDGVMFEGGGDGGRGVVPLMVPSGERGVLDVMVFGETLEEVDGVCAEMDARLRGRGLNGIGGALQ